jgi:uncharacterized damage-inducible protein DinB
LPLQIFIISKNKKFMTSVDILSKQFALHNRLFNNVLEGIEDASGGMRLNDQVNHLQWIAGHLVDTRYKFAPMFGLQASYPHTGLFTDATKPPPNKRALDESITYPPLSETLQYWNDIASQFAEAVGNVTDEQAASELPFGTPIGGKSLLGLLGFLTSHESYHIGQMSIVRKYLGLSAMSYR